MRPLFIVFAAMDPRGNKIGGVETHIRHLLRNPPKDADLLHVGLDEAGDLQLGQVIEVPFDGRHIPFLPIAHVPADRAHVSAARLTQSTTLRFVLGGLRYIGAIRRQIGARPASADLPRVEFAALPIVLGIPHVVTIHGDGAKIDKTDSLLKRHGLLKTWSERLALSSARHIYAVSDAISADLAERHPSASERTSVMPVPVDTDRFRPSPFPRADKLRIVYAGRFDEQKDPRLMFQTIAATCRRLSGAVEFHIVGATDPDVFAEFAAIRDVSIRHGACDAARVASIIAEAHCGILTSHSEGLPCFLLETLASGRAFGATHLPAFDPFILPERTGFLVPRQADRTAMVEAVAAGFATLWQDIRAGRLSPNKIAQVVAPFSVQALLARLYATHARIRADLAVFPERDADKRPYTA